MKKNAWKAPTLNDVLADVNMTTEPAEFGAKRILDKDGQELFCGGAGEVWQWLRDEGHHYSTCSECGRDHSDVELDIKGFCEDCVTDLDRRGELERARDEYESRGDYLRDQQKDEYAGMSRRDAAYYAGGENWRGE